MAEKRCEMIDNDMEEACGIHVTELAATIATATTTEGTVAGTATTTDNTTF